MKKKVVLLVTAAILAASGAVAVNSAMSMKWVKVSDPCGKCTMTDAVRKCGKCGGFMASKEGTTSKEQGYVKCTFKCNNKKCGHEIIYKFK